MLQHYTIILRIHIGPEELLRNNDSLRDGLSGDRIPMAAHDFPHAFRQALGPIQPPVKGIPALCPKIKRPGIGVAHPSSSSAEVKERVELVLYFPSGPSRRVIKVNFKFYYIYSGNCALKCILCSSSFLRILATAP